jgi:superfamily II DNA or RNA helicase/HKD family nuclease
LNNIDIIPELQRSLITGCIDGSAKSLAEYQPKLLLNGPESKVLSSIITELKKCEEFFFSVAFVTNGGVAVLIETLKELEKKGVSGKIIVSEYQYFTEPRALERLIGLKNLDIRIISEEQHLHSKGYILKNNKTITLIVGSSNLTQEALCKNQEWNIKITTSSSGSLIVDTFEEFNRLYNCATPVTPEWLHIYKQIYKRQHEIERRVVDEFEKDSITPILPIIPNKMQNSALESLELLRSEGRKKALLISATGTGKTYLSTFDVKIVNPSRFLFVVHRENIARTVMKSFKRIFGESKKMGILTGSEKHFEADYIFSTIQTLSKPDILKKFSPDYFDYIVIDEVHRSGAVSYRTILDHFNPNFLLGMTATPERTDGYDIFKAFDYNIAYEIRLHKALEEDMLSPFHYYGVTDISINGKLLDDFSEFNKLVSNERVERIIENSRFYGCDRGRIKGLIFCCRVEEAKELSEKLNLKGYRTVALSGENDEKEREVCIERLESDDRKDYLDYILTVGIFNEGVDIPSVNQIIMLRPTQSAIVFVQQLGRGLRKAEDKDFLTVIDFIGNYSNNYLVPIALYGDSSYNKDTLRKLLSTGSNLIPGASTVNFDQVSKQRIYEAIDTARVNSYKELKDDYLLLKYKLGRIPSMTDFVEHGSRDPMMYVEKDGSLYAFIDKQENIGALSPLQIRRLSFFAKEVCDGKRLEEALLLKLLIKKGQITLEEFAKILREEHQIESNSIKSSIDYLNGEFHQLSDREKYSSTKYVELSNERILSKTKDLDELLASPTFFLSVLDSINFALNRFTNSFDSKQYFNGFSLYHKYSRKDVCRILNWPKDEHSTIYGYKIKSNTCPIFVTYSKREDIDSSIKYQDYFFNNKNFHWMTRHNRKVDSQDVQSIQRYTETGLRICLFVKKSDAESDDFYYISDLTPYEYNSQTIKDDKGNNLPIVNINYEINTPVAENIYNYLTGE